MKTFIIIPVYNEAQVIMSVIKSVKKEGFRNIIVIDDGSTDDTFEKLRKEKIILLRHYINCGKGTAIKTGIEAAKKLRADFIVTIDGDGQHNPKDIKKLQKKLLGKYDVVLGYRKFDRKTMPAIKIFANHVANLLTMFFYGIKVMDSQSGFRGYSKEAFNSIAIENSRYEYDSEIIKEIARKKLKFFQMPIDVFYTPYSKTKKQKQNFSNGMRAIYKMVTSL